MGGSKAGLHNQNFDFNIWPTVGFVDSAKLANVLEADLVTDTRRERAALDDSPLMKGWQISIQAGCAGCLMVAAKPEHAGRYVLESGNA